MRETKRAKWRKQRRQCPELRKSSRAFHFISQHPESKPLFTNTTSVSFWNYSNKPQAISNKLQWRHGAGSERQREHPLLLFPLHFSLSASGLAYQLSEQQNTVERQAVRSPTGAAEDLQRLSSRLQLPGLQRPSSQSSRIRCSGRQAQLLAGDGMLSSQHKSDPSWITNSVSLKTIPAPAAICL